MICVWREQIEIVISITPKQYAGQCRNLAQSAPGDQGKVLILIFLWKLFLKIYFQTKLTELGAYVDDELPDYVLVMVANRHEGFYIWI